MKHFKYKKIHFVVPINDIVTEGNHFFTICNMLDSMLQIILAHGKVTRRRNTSKIGTLFAKPILVGECFNVPNHQLTNTII